MKSVSLIENKLIYFKKHPIITLIVIGGISLVLRFYHFPYDIPLVGDALYYFWYANDIAILGHLPEYLINNDGWSILISIFFSTFHSENFMDYMYLQRVLSILLSVSTIFPVYLICKKFFGKNLALFGAFLFAFEPRLILNSLQGITEPIYILLVATSILLFLSSNKKIILISFFVIGLSTLVRTEGYFLFFAISLMFFVRFRNNWRDLLKYIFGATLFVLTISSLTFLRINVAGVDPSIGKLQSSTAFVSQQAAGGNEGFIFYIITGLENLIKFLGWDLIPIFIVFVPIGFFLALKNRSFEINTIIISMIFLTLPALFAYSQGAFDTRYLYPMYPMFCVVSIFTIRSIQKKVGEQKRLLVLIISIVVLSSIIFIDFKNLDLDHEKEAIHITQQIEKHSSVINNYFPESFYFTSLGLKQVDFPILKSDFNDPSKMSFCADVKTCDALLEINSNSIDEFLDDGKSRGLTHLVVDSREHFSYRPLFFKDIFDNENKFPYLIKEFDSIDNGYTYHLKIFKIDYDKFEELR